MDGLCLKTGIHMIPPAITIYSGLDARSCPFRKSTLAAPSQRSPSCRFYFRYSLKSLWPGGVDNERRCEGLHSNDAVLVEGRDAKSGECKWKWVLKILQINPVRSHETVAGEETVGNTRVVSGEAHCGNGGGDDECDVCRVAEDDDGEIEFNRESFLKMLRKVSLAEAKLYTQLSYLVNLAYSIPKIKAGNLWKFHRLRFVISSFEKREVTSKAENNHTTAENQGAEGDRKNKGVHKEQQTDGYEGSASAAYQIALSAAAYHTKASLPLKSLKAECDEGADCTGSSDRVDEMMNSDAASLTATKDTVAVVVAAEEEVRRGVADDLNSTSSSPCHWFICDDDRNSTRFFVIQGSESLASWQANLLFEPIQFEGLDVLVHRGIYDAAKAMYGQMLPEVRAHLQAHGKHAFFRFTGHSLGGSLSLLVSLMLLVRGEVPVSCFLPVIAFGSPSIMCGGDRLFRELGLPRSHVQAIIMHRDIVPRAFSCHCPSQLSQLLKAVKGNFRNHPCLNNQEMLYSPMGELLILQPDDKFSPQHHLLPSGSGLYLLNCPWSPFRNTQKQLQAAERLFLNSPHPLEILGELTAYGSEGSIWRDHDMESYLKSLRGVIREERNRIRKDRRVSIHKMRWYLVLQVGIHTSILLGRSVASFIMGQQGLHISVILRSGKESSRRFGRLAASQQMDMLVLVFYNVKLLVLRVCSVISIH